MLLLWSRATSRFTTSAEAEVRATLNRMSQKVEANTVFHASSKVGCLDAMRQRHRARAVA